VFRLNLYPESRHKRRARRARINSAFVIGILSGLILVATFFHAVTANLIAERTQALHLQIAQWQSKTNALKTQAGVENVGSLEAKLLNRARRVVWSPKLAELAREVPAAVLIDRIAVDAGRGQDEPEFFVQGRIPTRPGLDEVAVASDFLDQLKANPVMSTGLLNLELSSVREELVQDEVRKGEVVEMIEKRETVFRIVSPYEEPAAL
jgi:cell division protein FtsB